MSAQKSPPTPLSWPTSTGQQVRLIGPNPAMDRINTVERLTPGSVHRSSDVSVRAGGKSSIVARTLRRLGVGVTMYGFLGGPIADALTREYVELGIDDRHTRIAGATRVTTVVVESASGRSTVLNELGPHISKAEFSDFADSLLGDIGAGDLVVCTGSLPVGIAEDFYGQVAVISAARGAFAAVDASGNALRQALESAPWCVKCNRHELTDALGLGDAADDAEVVEAMRVQVDRGSSIVIVTMGASNFLSATADGVWQVTVPKIDVVNATGSGDTFFGSFIAAIWHGKGLAEALQDGTAGGVVNAAQLEPGLQPGASLEPYRSQVSFQTLDVREPSR